MRKVITGVLDIVLGAVLAIGTRTFLHVCGSGMSMEGMDMSVPPCHGIPTASLITGSLLAAIGLVVILTGIRKDTETKAENKGLKSSYISLILDISNVIAGIIIIGIPTFIIGVCGSAHMHCHMVTRPALIIIGAVTVLAGIINIVLANASQKAASQVENQQKETEDKKKVVLTAEL